MKNGSFLSLVSVENTKLWKRLSTKIVVILLAVMTVGFIGVYKLSSVQNQASLEKAYQQSQSQKIDWRESLKASNEDLQQKLDVCEKSDSLSIKSNIDSYKKEISENNYRLDNNMAPETDIRKTNFWDLVNDMGMWEFVALLVIITTSALVAGEFAENTMKTMVSRPFSRNQILSAKLLTTILFTVEMMIMTYLLTVITTGILFGLNGIDSTTLLWIGGKTVAVSGLAGSLITLGLDLLSTLIFVLFSFFLSTVTHSRAAATGFSIFVVFGSSIFSELALHFDWAKYIYFAETTFSSFMRKGMPIFGVSLGFAIFYNIVCTLILLIASYFTYEKRDIN